MKKLTLATLAVTCSLLVACNNASSTDTASKPAKTQTTSANIAKNTTDKQLSDVAKALQDNLDKSGIDITVTSAVATAMPGMYWVSFEGAPAMFTDVNGEHLIQGQIVKLGDGAPIDITSSIQADIAKDKLSNVDKKDMIIYPAVGDTKAAIYVFSDPTCHYCQKLHSEIKQITAGGIEVRYLAWPRGEQTIPLTEAIWCSADRHNALTRAKKGENITAPTCDNPVHSQINLGHSLGVNGTPAIFAESGVQIGGYLPADRLIQAAIDNK
ncbi:thioredoxin fold domain-containing protein [Moraxella nasovis]|uniref:DsbC family protein n=1 Tax=Moraxella nasovis TaxID=2904121 RepID=UPI001F61155A|nr:DsbC family protein [Moraxella nasovis]UNU73668.1 thioredoxin fold domain-containing protein [Moraxella nasovis]